jgi:hypothetical protein
MKPYRSILPREMQETFEDILVMSFTEHPVGQALLARTRPRAEPSGSGSRAIIEQAGKEQRAQSSRGTSGGKGGSQ